jgi:hypothetical protein
MFSFLPTIPESYDEIDSMAKFYVITKGVGFFRNFMPCLIVILIFLTIFGLLHLTAYIVGNLMSRSLTQENN